jgi:hypothetical protein
MLPCKCKSVFSIVKLGYIQYVTTNNVKQGKLYNM